MIDFVYTHVSTFLAKIKENVRQIKQLGTRRSSRRNGNDKDFDSVGIQYNQANKL